MPRLVYLAAARRNLSEIAAYIERESASRVVSKKFVGKLMNYCEQIAKLPSLVGRARPEIGNNYRSITFGSYVIFLRYADEDGPRSHLYIIHIVHGARDLDAYFIQYGDS
ncbi:type II toxin-antitoxin system RelE/ParE family toxin [Candidatus Magnetominusculus dajiuhuensis]|uniref:type II toxin-antitoxin system RelE/ParE family toxin n=1 Tax=Candidatus Magnetominusculus dajiuhuensis TaxID=3137712 RepID=UPI003B428FCD